LREIGRLRELTFRGAGEGAGDALEIGRSFVRPEYQKQYAPLLLLWKSITRYVSAHPECAVLFGAVSISNDYNPVSRSLLAGYLETQMESNLARLIKPRRPYRPKHGAHWHAQAVSRFLQDVEELSAPIVDLERDGKGLPILIKQYMKAGGRVLGFNIDPRFSNVLDVLMMADLRRAPQPILERYMGPEAAAAFLGRAGQKL
jgi:putative hemolysin